VVPAISAVSAISGFAPIAPIAPVSTSPTSSVSGTGGASFGNALSQGIDSLQQTQSTADGLATKASTGTLSDVTDYMVASNEAAIATQLTTAVRDKAVASFQSIMNMQM
jgi:flagellar hook-basal body complex protein FliE